MIHQITDSKNFTVIPTDLDLVMDNPTECWLIVKLIGMQREKTSCYINQDNLSKITKISKATLIRSINSLVAKGYVKYIKGNSMKKANEYTVCIDKIMLDIKYKITNDSVPEKDHKVYSESQKDAMTVKRCVDKPHLAYKAINKIGGVVFDEKGYMQNGDVVKVDLDSLNIKNKKDGGSDGSEDGIRQSNSGGDGC